MANTARTRPRPAAAGSRKGKAGGFAALAAAGSLAFRRDKLGGLMGRKRGSEPATPGRSGPPTTPSG